MSPSTNDVKNIGATRKRKVINYNIEGGCNVFVV